MVLVVKNPPANAGDIRDSGSILGQEDALEEGMATHSSILACLAGCRPWSCKESNVTEQLSTHD